jgi:type IV fimbrial biogenesis protein FimT
MRIGSFSSLFRHERGPAARIHSGFTAIELMVVIALLAILAAIAMPQFRDVLNRYKVRRAVEEMRGTLYLARTESIKRGGQVTLRRIASADCAPASGEWSCGWMLFADANENATLDGTDTVLQTSSAPMGVRVEIQQGDSAPESLQADRWGQWNEGPFNFIFRPVDDVSDSLATTLCLLAGGWMYTSHGAHTCDE